MTIEERTAALEAKVVALEKAADSATRIGERALERAETAIGKRFDASNEIREAMRDQSQNYVTRGEFQWAIGAVVLVLLGMLIRLAIR